MKSGLRIVYENVFTLFNFLNFSIAALLLAVGAYSNILFILIVLANIVIGTAQELKAKRLAEKLTLLNRPLVRICRDGKEYEVSAEEITKGDVMVLRSGDQVCNDAIVSEGMLEVNESLLTGECDAVVKEEGSSLLSGSSVISGKAYAEVVHVGEENYARRISAEVKKSKKPESELLDSMNKVTRLTGFLIFPLGILLFLESFVFRGDAVNLSVISSSAALLGMLPKGLVLLISVSLAAGVIRLAKMKILIQDIYSLESLSHVDVLCFDKTGTLTDGTLRVVSVIPYSQVSEGEMAALIKSYFFAADDNNTTFQALRKVFGEEQIYRSVKKIPFSSKRKWGSVSFADEGSVFIGAPEKLLPEIPDNVRSELEAGRRVVSIGYYGDKWEDEKILPAEIRPLYFVSMEDSIRRGVENTMAFFQREGINIKVISGDHVKTASVAAKKAGISGWKNAVDMSLLERDEDLKQICDKYTVFARVSPDQKKALIKAFKNKGHRVAMTGDGVNDLLAMRESDCSIAVCDGSDASRQIAQVVMLGSDFTGLPYVVMEGRRVVNNVTRTAGVFFIKTVYSLIVSLFCIAVNIPFPFIPLQITLVDAFMEAYPSFLTVFESDTRKIEGSFLRKVIIEAFPFGMAVAMMIAVVSQTAPFSQGQIFTVTYIMLISISYMAVLKSCVPFNKLRAFICVTIVVGISGILTTAPWMFNIGTVNIHMALYMMTALIIAAVLIFAIRVVIKKMNKYILGNMKKEGDHDRNRNNSFKHDTRSS